MRHQASKFCRDNRFGFVDITWTSFLPTWYIGSHKILSVLMLYLILKKNTKIEFHLRPPSTCLFYIIGTVEITAVILMGWLTGYFRLSSFVVSPDGGVIFIIRLETQESIWCCWYLLQYWGTFNTIREYLVRNLNSHRNNKNANSCVLS